MCLSAFSELIYGVLDRIASVRLIRKGFEEWLAADVNQSVRLISEQFEINLVIDIHRG